MFLAMWLPWSRIDRATFQYHFFTSAAVLVMALAYFLAELWHGPSPGTWQLRAILGGSAIIGAPLLWLFRVPLCGLADPRAGQQGHGGVRLAVARRSPLDRLPA